MSADSRVDPSRRGEVEIAHFWEAGDGERMLRRVLEEFRSRHPNVRVTDTGYDNHGLEIKTRMLRANPPDVFVEWPDRNLEPYHRANGLADLTDLWEANGWPEAFVEGPRERVRFDGEYVAIPVDIHRMNNLFYHVDLVEEYGVDPRRIDDPRELLEVLRQCDDEGMVGMHQPMKNPWTVAQLWANVVLGQFGPDAFEGITRGNTAAHEDEIRESVGLIDAYADLASEDAYFLDMVDANERFMAGTSVFFHQGDWVAAEYGDRADFAYGRDWDRVNFPGTDGVYMMGVDAIAASPGAADREDVRTFLEFVASPDVLETLNRIKGSIPPRRDVSMDAYPELLQEQHRDFTSARAFPAGHALQVSPEAFIEAKIAFASFVAERDVEATTRDLVEAYSKG